MPDKVVRSGEFRNYSVGSGKSLTHFVIDREDMVFHTGKSRGALPMNCIINGVRWEYVKTGVVKGRTYDKIRNTETGEKKTFERPVLLAFLKKNWKKWQKNIKKDIVNSDNNRTFEKSKEAKQIQMVMPKLDF